MRISDWSSDVCSSDLKDAEKRLAKVDAELAGKLAAAESEIGAARTSAMAEIEAVAAEAAGDLVAKLSGVKIAAADAKAAVKAVLHGCFPDDYGGRRDRTGVVRRPYGDRWGVDQNGRASCRDSVGQ